jgi:hypothetical protein
MPRRGSAPAGKAAGVGTVGAVEAFVRKSAETSSMFAPMTLPVESLVRKELVKRVHRGDSSRRVFGEDLC